MNAGEEEEETEDGENGSVGGEEEEGDKEVAGDKEGAGDEEAEMEQEEESGAVEGDAAVADEEGDADDEASADGEDEEPYKTKDTEDENGGVTSGEQGACSSDADCPPSDPVCSEFGFCQCESYKGSRPVRKVQFF